MKITLQEWAKRNFDPPPCKATLHSYAKTGQIIPAPVKVGRYLMCDEDAVYSPLIKPTGNDKLSKRALEILNGTQAA